VRPSELALYGGFRDDLRNRNRNDESAPALTIFLLLLHDLVLEVPRKEKQIIRRPRFKELGGIVYAQVDPGHCLSLLMDAAIDDVIEQTAVDP
jgi:hypothetical protein